ncbi:MAG: chlorite dismutase family protein [Candidatus Micrarchaeaceae archaeon]
MGSYIVNVLGFKFTDKWWSSSSNERRALMKRACDAVERLGKNKDVEKAALYSSLRYDTDIISWVMTENPDDITLFRATMEKIFGDKSMLRYGFLSVYEPRNIGYTRSRKVSLPYFVAYPMSKSPDWYLLSEKEKSGIMSEHIRVATTHKDNRGIKSYTTQSFGIDDNEFLVLYEVPSIEGWMHVTQDLRGVQARKWITNDRPILVGRLGGFGPFLI